MLIGNLLEAIFEGLVVLEAKDGGRSQHRDLAAILHCLERCPHGDFGFAIADIADQQAIHGESRLHVALDVCDGGDLVFGLVVVEGVFELPLKVVVRRKGMPMGRLALGVELEQLVGHILHGLAHPRFGLGPLLAAQPIEHRRRPGIGGAVFLDQVEPGERDIEPRLFGELQHHELHSDAFLLDLLQPHIAGDAVLHVDHVVAYREVAEVGDEGRCF